jgi:hypothetical protein
LLHQPAGQRIELGDAARVRNPSVGHAAVGLDGERDSDPAADPRIAEMPGIIRRPDFTGNQFEVAAAASLAKPLPA